MTQSKNIRLTIEKNVFGGDGLARLNSKVYFVENAVAGEVVEARVLHEKKDWNRARAVKILEASRDRQQPLCAHYGYCGGCQYQHVSYALELAQKESQIREIFAKFQETQGRISPILHAKNEYGYRRSATFHIGAEGSKRKPFLGYVAKDNISLVKIKQCDILQPALSDVFSLTSSLPAVTRAKKPDKRSFKLAKNGKIVSDEKELFYSVVLSGEEMLVSSKGFFQNNWEVTEILADKVRDFVLKTKPEVFYDLFSGVGTFTFLCADSVPRVVCVEESPYAVSALRMNCQNKGQDRIQIFEGKVEKVFEEYFREQAEKESLIFLDPPRQGLAKGLAEFLGRDCGARALVYVSCDPTTLARDLQTILAYGKWHFEELVPLDMFPRTKHMEAVAFLTHNPIASGGAIVG